jgi:prepilin-type N-terminal cleavage/methylation domain-containing protein
MIVLAPPLRPLPDRTAVLTRKLADPARGFTLIETMVAVVIMGVVAGIAATGWSGYSRASEQTGTRNDVVSALRAANQRALTEAFTYCVRFSADAKSWSTYRGTCASGTVIKGPETVESAKVTITDLAFVQSDGSTSRDVVFTPRGTASKGSLKIRREGASKVYTVTVEGLTARVSSS